MAEDIDILRFKDPMPNGGVPMFASDWTLLQAQMLQASSVLYKSLSPDMILSGLIPTYNSSFHITAISAGYVLLGGEIYRFPQPSSYPPSAINLYVVIDESEGDGTKTAEYIPRMVKSPPASVPVVEIKKAIISSEQPGVDESGSQKPYIKFSPLPSATSYSPEIIFPLSVPSPSRLAPVYLEDLIALNSRKKGEIITYVGDLLALQNLNLFVTGSSNPNEGLGLYSFKGFALCNGKNGTQNLKGRFIVGYDSAAPTTPLNATAKELNYGKIGNTGGEAAHQLSISEMPSHTHNFTDDYSYVASSASGGATNKANSQTTQNDTTGSTGGNVSHENRPPYYTVAYIQKIV